MTAQRWLVVATPVGDNIMTSRLWQCSLVSLPPLRDLDLLPTVSAPQTTLPLPAICLVAFSFPLLPRLHPVLCHCCCFSLHHRRLDDAAGLGQQQRPGGRHGLGFDQRYLRAQQRAQGKRVCQCVQLLWGGGGGARGGWLEHTARGTREGGPGWGGGGS